MDIRRQYQTDQLDVQFQTFIRTALSHITDSTITSSQQQQQQHDGTTHITAHTAVNTAASSAGSSSTPSLASPILFHQSARGTSLRTPHRILRSQPDTTPGCPSAPRKKVGKRNQARRLSGRVGNDSVQRANAKLQEALGVGRSGTDMEGSLE